MASALHQTYQPVPNPLAVQILEGLPPFKGNACRSILDEVAYWLERSHSGAAIQDALEWLWGHQFIQTDDPDSPPVFPRASVVMRSEGGDKLIAINKALPHQKRLAIGLAAIRKSRGWNNKEMAVALGVSEPYMSLLSRGLSDVKISMLDRMVRSFKVTSYELLPYALISEVKNEKCR